MTEPDPAADQDDTPASGTSNTAGPGSVIGIQAEQVHNSPVYQILPDDPPERKYEVGVSYLEHGVPGRALELINEAIANGYKNSRVLFHWTLAMLSKRSYRDLSSEERKELKRVADDVDRHVDDEWKRALVAVCALLDRLNNFRPTPGRELNQLNALPSHQRARIVRHLDLVLTGGMKDNLWAETHRAARRDRLGDGRLKRVWAYFAPEPAKARARPAVPDTTTSSDRHRATAWSALLAGVVAYVGWSLIMHATPLPIISYLLALVAGCGGAIYGQEWLYRTRRLSLKEKIYSHGRKVKHGPDNGFASEIDHAFDYYFSRYTPRNTDRVQWLSGTVGVRNVLRNEIVEIYREGRTEAGQVRWLIRYLVSDVRARWENDILFKYRELYRTESSIKVKCCVSLAVLTVGAVYVIVTAVEQTTLPTMIAMFIGLNSGRRAVTRWLHILHEKRRHREDHDEREQNLRDRDAAYQRWKKKLDDSRPSETQMEGWLNCDKTIVLGEALEHYRLA